MKIKFIVICSIFLTVILLHGPSHSEFKVSFNSEEKPLKTPTKKNIRNIKKPVNKYGQSWVLVHKGKGSVPDFYYDENSLKNINQEIVEFNNLSANPKGYSVRQMLINCLKNEFAFGHVAIYIGEDEAPSQEFEFNKNGWVWSVPRDDMEKKLIKIACENE